MNQKQYGIFSLPVIVGALGFFVDIYDLLLFSIVRRASFADLGVPESELKNVGESIISWQMIGLTIGGIFWGILGDKKGRKNVLFGSILLYSLATIANGFVKTIDQYCQRKKEVSPRPLLQRAGFLEPSPLILSTR